MPALPCTPTADGSAASAAAKSKWCGECRAHFDTVATLAVLFAVRSAPLFLHSVAETVAQQANGRVFDFVTLRALAKVHPALISWVQESSSPGAEGSVASPQGAAPADVDTAQPWAAAEAAWEAECAAADAAGGASAALESTRFRIVVAFDRNSDTGGVKGNATVGATRARPKKKLKQASQVAKHAASWMGGGHDGLASLLLLVRQEFADRCAAMAKATPLSELPPLCAAEEKTVRSASNAPSGSKTHPSWPRCRPVTATNFLEYVQSEGVGPEPYSGQLVSVEVFPKRKRQLVDVGTVQLSLPVQKAARALHTHLYSHQAEAIASALSGKDTVVTTSTASGKSMVYTLVIAETFRRHPLSKFLLLFPTKALAHDQKQRLVTLFERLAPGLRVGVIDGDTPHAARKALVCESHVLLTNPDLLHYTVLPQHTSTKWWASFLDRLRVVVIDELHVYHGVFGTNVAFVLRRLRRLCNAPLVIGCSATLANAAQHFAAVIGSSPSAVKVVSEDGSPCGRKQFALWNPPILEDLEDDPTALSGCSIASHKHTAGLAPSTDIGFGAVRGPRRSSSVNEAAALLALLVQHGIRTLAFVKARTVAELLLRKTRERLQAGLRNRVESYRAGYTAADRRETELDLRSGRAIAVVATNALELGIDIGGVVATLHLGYPGNSAALRQQMGRAGRAVEDSLAIMIPLDAPLDQSFVAAATSRAESGRVDGVQRVALHPNAQLSATIDVANPLLLATHLALASAESPLRFRLAPPSTDMLLFGASAHMIAKQMVVDGRLQRIADNECQACYAAVPTRARPAGLRGIGNQRKWRVVHDGRVLEEVEESRALETLFAGAIFVSRGVKYMVCEATGINQWATRCGQAAIDVQVERSSADYFTEAQAIMEIRGTENANTCSRQLAVVGELLATACHGAVTIAKTVHSYRRRRAVDRKIVDSVALFQQPNETQCHALWLRLPAVLERETHDRGWSYERGGLHAAEHALIAVAPAFARLEAQDLGCQCRRLDMIGPATKHLVIYEKPQGGVGLAAQLFEHTEPMMCAALKLMESCGCQAGCPGCVHMEACEEFNQRLSKTSAIYQLRRILGASQEAASHGLHCGEVIGDEPGPAVRDKHKRMRSPLDC